MKITVVLTVVMVGLNSCRATENVRHTQEMESIEQCLAYAASLMDHEFVVSATCEERKSK